jgi:hypothetical protein
VGAVYPSRRERAVAYDPRVGVDEGQGFFDGELDAYICACQVPSRSATVTAT